MRRLKPFQYLLPFLFFLLFILLALSGLERSPLNELKELTTTGSLRSTSSNIFPPSVINALQSLGMSDFPALVQASDMIKFTPPGGKGKALVSAINGKGKFWNLANSGSWEITTFNVYHSVLQKRPGIVVDFGSWIGPTVLAAALSTSSKVFSLEVDPVAFTQLAWNVASNPHIASKVSVFFLGISEKVEMREFNSGSCTSIMGDSCSSMTTKSLDPIKNWKVPTMPLKLFFEIEGVSLSEVSLVKVDTEGAEYFIFPSLVEWLHSYRGVKPVFWVSLHGKFVSQSDFIDRITPFFKLFKYGYLEKGGILELQWNMLENALWDGVVSFILSQVGEVSNFFVEIGVGDGSECITRFLREKGGWKGVLMDGCCENPALSLYREVVTPENIGSLMLKYAVPSQPDLLVIDTDVYDYYLLESVLKKGYRPRVIVVEVNSKISPAHAKTLKYLSNDPNYGWDGGDYFGMSVAAAHGLAHNWGYSMVYCEWSGINCFLVQNELLGASLSKILTPALLQRSPQYGPHYCGWPRDKNGRTFIDVAPTKKTSAKSEFINLPRCSELQAW